MMPALELKAVTRRIAGKTLIDGLSLDLRGGRLTVLVGPNGAGKSTLIGLASGLARPDSGEVLCAGRPLAAWPRWRLAAKRVVMSQSGAIAFAFRAEDVVAIGCDGIGRGIGSADRQMIVRQAMAIADIGHLAERDFATLSGGEQQRVRFARALAQLHAGRTVEGDQILILDEPVASLDLKHQVFLLDAARDLARAGVAVMVVLHDLTLARAYADEIVVVSDGRIAARGSADAVLHAPLITRVFGLAKERQHALLPWMG